MEGWKKMAFADVATKFFSGGTPSTKDSSLWDGDIQWITSKWLNERLYLSYGEKNISEKGLRSSATKLVKARSMILATRVGVGKVSINEIDLAINQDLLGIEIDEYNYSLEFLAYQLRSQKSQDYISSFKRGATIQGVTQDCIKSIELNIPPLPEQHKIAHVLNKVQKAIEQQDKLIRTTTDLKKALMQKFFAEGTRGEPQKETEIGLVPVSWEVKKVGDLSILYTGGTPSTKNEDYYNPKEIPWMKSGEITGKRIKSVSNFISNEGMNNSNARLLPVNSVVIALNGRGKTRGTTAILDFECTCNQSVICILPNSKDELNTEFLYYYLSYLYEFIRNLTGNNDRSGLSMSKIRLIPLMVPEIKEQIKIGDTLQYLDDKIVFHW